MSHGEFRWEGAQTASTPAAARHHAPRAAPYTGAIERRSESASGHVRDGDRTLFLDLVLGADDGAPGAFIDTLRGRGADVAAIYLELLGPTAVSLGDMWVADSCDFVDVTVGVGRLQRAVRQLGSAFLAAGPSVRQGYTGRMLLSPPPGDQHTLGMYMVAEFMLRDGWGVRVGMPTTGEELAALVRAETFDVVGFSAACDTRLLALRHEIAAVRRSSRNPQVRILVGGRLFVDHPELAERVGADAFATSAADAPGRARALLPAARA